MARFSPSRGAIYALLAAGLFGLSTPLAKLLVGRMDSWLLAGLLYLGTGVGLCTWIGLRRLLGRPRLEAGLGRRQLGWLAGAIVAGGLVAPVLLASGLRTTTGAASALLLNLEGVFTGLIAWTVFREHTTPRLILGTLVIVGGSVVLTGAFGSDTGLGGSLSGVGLIALACLCWAIDNNCTRPAADIDPVVIAASKGAVAGTMNTLLAISLGAAWPGAWPIVAALCVGLTGYGISLVLFVVALRQLGSGRTSAYFATAPFVGSAFALVLGDVLGWQILVAGLLMGVGVWLHLSESHNHRHEHEPMEHDHIHVHDVHHQHGHGPDELSGEPHSHWHRHEPLVHAHAHAPDAHHRHQHA